MAKKHMKKCSLPLAQKEMEIKTTLRFHLTLVRLATIKNTRNGGGRMEKQPGEDVTGSLVTFRGQLCMKLLLFFQCNLSPDYLLRVEEGRR
jgi:hypothetical protein